MESTTRHLPFDPRPPAVPAQTALLSGAALAVPLLAEAFFADQAAEYHVLLWLLALVPAFLLAFHSGWKGAATALAAGMVVLTLAQVLTIMNGHRVENWPLLLSVVAVYITISLGIGFLSEQLHQQRTLAERLAYSDELTGAPNRRFADVFLDMEFAAAERGRPLVVVLSDLDHFKAYNDRHGHQAGDEALRAFAEILLARTRRSNLSARYGGEEFLTILSSSTVEGALHFVNGLRERLRNAPTLAPITVSAGIAAYQSDMSSPEELLRAADSALYEAKGGGRDRVRVHGRATTDQPEETLQHSA